MVVVRLSGGLDMDHGWRDRLLASVIEQDAIRRSLKVLVLAILE